MIAVFPLSCATGEGLDEFRRRLFALVPEPEPVRARRGRARRLPRLPPAAEGARRGGCCRTDGGFRVLGTPPSEEELERALRAAGREGRRDGRDRRRGVRARLMIGLFGGVVRPAASRPRRARAPREGGARARPAASCSSSADPGHKHVETPADVRLRLARAAFPDDEVVLDEHARTVDTLRAHPEWGDPVFLIGADEFCDFLSWREPDEVLEPHAARRRDAARLPARAPRRRCSAQLEAARARALLRDRADPGRLARAARPPRSRRGRRPTTCRRRSRA